MAVPLMHMFEILPLTYNKNVTFRHFGRSNITLLKKRKYTFVDDMGNLC